MIFLGKEEKCDNLLEIIIVGQIRVGKTIFAKRLESNDYYEFKSLPMDYYPTIGFDYMNKNIKIKNKKYTLNFMVFSGNQVYERLISSLYKKANIFLIFYDCFEPESFEIAKTCYNQIKAFLKKEKITNNKIYCLVRNKYELNIIPNENKNIITDEEVLEFANENKIYFAHASSLEKYETGIKELLEFVIIKYFERNNIV